jgi:hypothetical protein
MRKLRADYIHEMLAITEFSFPTTKLKILKTIVHVAYMGVSETWSLTLRKGEKNTVFENIVLMRIFESKREEVIEGWMKLHNEGVHNLYFLPNIIRLIKLRKMR